jgi:hypothetical protein
MPGSIASGTLCIMFLVLVLKLALYCSTSTLVNEKLNIIIIIVKVGIF